MIIMVVVAINKWIWGNIVMDKPKLGTPKQDGKIKF